MPIRNYIILSRMFLVMLLGAIIIIGWYASDTIRRDMRHIEFTNKQLVTLACLSSALNEVSMKIGRLFILTDSSIKDIQTAKSEVSKFISDLKNTTDQEYKWLANTPEKAEENKTRARVEHLLALSREASRVFNMILSSRENDPAQSRQLYARKVINELEPQIKLIIKNAMSDEEAKVVKMRLKTDNNLAFYGSTIGILIAFIAIFSTTTGLLAYLSLVSPLNALAANTDEFEKSQVKKPLSVKSYATEIIRLMGSYNKLATDMGLKQQRLASQKTDLEDQISERTKEITATNDKLKKLDRMRTQFLADISHELKTPLTALRGEAEIGLRRKGQDENVYRGTLTRIKVLSEQMNFLVDDLLFLARSETDTIHFDLKKTDLESIISSAIDSYEIMGRENEINIKTTWSSEPVEIAADIVRLKQAFGIILDNAIKYSTPKTEIRLTISTSNTNKEVVTMVTNQGIGIPKEDLPFIFERFYRGSKTSGSGGIGLGLPIAKWIIEKHNGSIHLTSSGKGITEVTISLPRIISG